MSNEAATNAEKALVLTDAERAGLTRIVDTVERLDVLTGGYSTKAEARLTGLSIHVKYAAKVEQIADSLAYQQLIEQAPGLLLTCAKRLLEAEAEAVCEFCGKSAPADQFHPEFHDDGSPMVSCSACIEAPTAASPSSPSPVPHNPEAT